MRISKITFTSFVLMMSSGIAVNGQDSRNEKSGRIVIGGGKVVIPENHENLERKLDTSEEAQLKDKRKASRAERAKQQKISNLRAKQQADMVARVGSQMIAGAVQNARKNAITTQENMEVFAGRRNPNDRTIFNDMSQNSITGSSSQYSNGSKRIYRYQCSSCSLITTRDYPNGPSCLQRVRSDGRPFGNSSGVSRICGGKLIELQ